MQHGGAINLEEPRFIDIVNNTFISNKVTDSASPLGGDYHVKNMMNAGAIYY